MFVGVAVGLFDGAAVGLLVDVAVGIFFGAADGLLVGASGGWICLLSLQNGQYSAVKIALFHLGWFLHLPTLLSLIHPIW